MNNYAYCTTNYNLGRYISPNYGVSPASQKIRELFINLMFDSFLKNTVDNIYISCLPSLYELFEEYSENNWDGYGASAINLSSYINAISFLMALPSSTQVPEISIETDGDVVFEWFVSWDRVFSVSIGPNCELHYAGLFEGRQISGLEYLEETIPKIIIDQIDKIFD